MVERHPLTVHVPIRGKLLLRIDGTDVLHEVGSFMQDVNIAFSPGPGEVSFSFDEKFWQANIKDKGVGGPTPQAAASVVEDALRANSTVARVLRSTNAFITDGDVRKVAGSIIQALEEAGHLK